MVLGLQPKDAKTRIVHMKETASTTVGCAPTADSGTFASRWPSRQAMQHARDRIRGLTDRKRLLLPVDLIVQDVNTFLRGWASYFRYGNSAHHLDAISNHAAGRLALFMAKRH
jgi:hypothetical protein